MGGVVDSSCASIASSFPAWNCSCCTSDGEVAFRVGDSFMGTKYSLFGSGKGIFDVPSLEVATWMSPCTSSGGGSISASIGLIAEGGGVVDSSCASFASSFPAWNCSCCTSNGELVSTSISFVAFRDCASSS